MKTELIIDGNAVYEIDVECRRRLQPKPVGGVGQASTGLELMAGAFQTDAVTCCLWGLLLCILWTHGK